MKTEITQLYAGCIKNATAQLTKLVKKCKKFGITEPTWKLSDEYTHTKQVSCSPDSAVDWSPDLQWYKIVSTQLVDLVIDHQPIHIKGDWVLIAVHSSKSGSISQLDASVIIPEEFLSGSRTCSHCNKNQYRKSHFIIHNKADGKWMQVGSTCLKDFLGINPTTYLKMFEAFRTTFSILNEDRWGHGYPDKEEFINIAYPIRKLISQTLKVINKRGHVKATWEDVEDIGMNGCRYYRKVRENEGDATCDFVTDYVTTPKKKDKEHSQVDEVLKFWEKVKVETKEVKGHHLTNEGWETRMGQEPKNGFNKWLSDSQKLISSPNALKSDINKVCSAVNYVLTSKEKEAERLLKAQESASLKYVGKVGDRMTLDLTIVKNYAGESEWGVYYITTLETKEKDQLVYKGSKDLGDVGDSLTMVFTVKAHSDFRGAKQTTLSRPKVTSTTNEAEAKRKRCKDEQEFEKYWTKRFAEDRLKAKEQGLTGSEFKKQIREEYDNAK
jgi:hypothetical protein